MTGTPALVAEEHGSDDIFRRDDVGDDTQTRHRRRHDLVKKSRARIVSTLSMQIDGRCSECVRCMQGVTTRCMPP
ncbi:hypothetical protein [Rhodanobacter sp. OK091]|jgi:hypothetical protein|uniref:hypothetical protein n=1 Tax=Rhodanobacter sp. OK091 TaxID=1881037 RepID=UPI00116066FC|nr:hypothetical protein [Rhodanobacter sp. OK091]